MSKMKINDEMAKAALALKKAWKGSDIVLVVITPDGEGTSSVQWRSTIPIRQAAMILETVVDTEKYQRILN